MFGWIKRRRFDTAVGNSPLASALKSTIRPVAGRYALLYEYLEHRYADTVVLTFAQIEDVVGCALPEQARMRREWWTDAAVSDAGTSYADAWRLASRTASPNLFAQIVTFDRAF
jgi:hypothetical protein